jgi:hypothetical protein
MWPLGLVTRMDGSFYNSEWFLPDGTKGIPTNPLQGVLYTHLSRAVIVFVDCFFWTPTSSTA